MQLIYVQYGSCGFFGVFFFLYPMLLLDESSLYTLAKVNVLHVRCSRDADSPASSGIKQNSSGAIYC